MWALGSPEGFLKHWLVDCPLEFCLEWSPGIYISYKFQVWCWHCWSWGFTLRTLARQKMALELFHLWRVSLFSWYSFARSLYFSYLLPAIFNRGLQMQHVTLRQTQKEAFLKIANGKTKQNKKQELKKQILMWNLGQIIILTFPCCAFHVLFFLENLFDVGYNRWIRRLLVYLNHFTVMT